MNTLKKGGCIMAVISLVMILHCEFMPGNSLEFCFLFFKLILLDECSNGDDAKGSIHFAENGQNLYPLTESVPAGNRQSAFIHFKRRGLWVLLLVSHTKWTQEGKSTQKSKDLHQGQITSTLPQYFLVVRFARIKFVV